MWPASESRTGGSPLWAASGLPPLAIWFFGVTERGTDPGMPRLNRDPDTLWNPTDIPVQERMRQRTIRTDQIRPGLVELESKETRHTGAH
jgi:hypothetical protein